MRRHLIGMLALLLLVGAGVFWIWPPQEAVYQQFQAACWRVGALMVVWWLAYPQLREMPIWLWVALPPLVFLLIRWPRLLVVAIPLAIFLAVIRPRPRPLG